MRIGEFSERDWNLAPQYRSPVDVPGMTVLDFAELQRLAREEQASGSFRVSEDGTLAKAPLFVDDLPGAFYRVDANHPDFTPNHNATDHETLVVMQGALRVVYNHGLDREDPESQAGTAWEGGVIELPAEPVSMQAVSLIDRASCLAVALFREGEFLIRPDFSFRPRPA